MDDTESEFTGPVNLGHPDEVSILALADLVLELTGSSSGIQFRQPPEDDPYRRRPDISLAENVLHWRPRISLGTRLAKTIAYFEEILKTPQRLEQMPPAQDALVISTAG